MSEMKSAFEKAMEKVEKLGKPTEEELKKLEYIPIGNTIAARYIQEENFNLDAELTKYKGQGIRQYILQGVQEIFIRNIVLPHSEHDKNLTVRAMAGIKLLKENKNKLDGIYDRINNLLTYYEQAYQQSFQQFKKNFETKLQESGAALQQRMSAGHNVEAEIQQQFQEEWRRMSSELDSQYEKTLEEHKQEILNIS
jgi:subtilase family serine protease